MLHLTTAPLSTPDPDFALRVGDFTLLPNNQTLPVVKSQPDKNIYQKTWIKSIENGREVYQKIKPSSGIFRVVEGTKVGWKVFASDPSNLANPNSDDNLSFYWRKDGTPLVELNQLNNGKGSKSILYSSSECTTDKTGRYICEISNQFGTIETAALDVEVIDLSKYPKLYTNLVINGNADSQTDGWAIDQDIISANFAKEWICSNGQSLPNLGYLYDELSQDGPTTQKELAASFEFAFNQNATVSTNEVFRPWMELGPDWRSITPSWMSSKSNTDFPLPGWAQWNLTGVTPQIIDNETPTEEFGAFFPAMKYIDSYNRNQDVVGLYEESKNQRLSYFTRDKLTFSKFGGKAVSQLTQTVDLTDLADFVDGNVFGVDYVTSQLFAYIGAGLTGYKIRADVSDSSRDRFKALLNWFIVDYEEFLKRIRTDDSSVKKALLPNTPIDIIPLAEDVTKIELNYLDELGNTITKSVIEGPGVREVFSIKDRTFFPISLYPLFEFFVENNNPIRVFGQTYTTTQALAPLFENDTPYPTTFDQFANQEGPELRFAAWGGSSEKLDRLTDNQAKFGLTKINWTKWGAWPGVEEPLRVNRRRRSTQELGAAAMFGVEKTQIVPKGTRSIQISIKFAHTSDVLGDNDPKAKKWEEQTIYLNSFGQSSGNSARVVDYSYPKCGITKVKMLIIPNKFSVSDGYASYKMPPFDRTVVGHRKQLLSLDVHNTSVPDRLFRPDTATGEFPLAAALQPTATSPFISNNQAQYLQATQQQEQVDLQRQSARERAAGPQGDRPEAFDTDVAEATRQ